MAALKKPILPPPRTVGLISDYFYPKVGGVESHMYMLAQRLKARGWKVVIITHAYPPPPAPSSNNHSSSSTTTESCYDDPETSKYPRTGVRYLTSGIKVYYIPIQPIPPVEAHATLPQYFTAMPLVRYILIRERIQILHAHGAMTSLGLESLMHARNLSGSSTNYYGRPIMIPNHHDSHHQHLRSEEEEGTTTIDLEIEDYWRVFDDDDEIERGREELERERDIKGREWRMGRRRRRGRRRQGDGGVVRSVEDMDKEGIGEGEGEEEVEVEYWPSGAPIRIRTLFTDHSLYSLALPGAMFGNKVLKGVLSDCDGVIGVSLMGKANLSLRSSLPPSKIYVIPNAVVAEQFSPPDEEERKRRSIDWFGREEELGLNIESGSGSGAQMGLGTGTTLGRKDERDDEEGMVTIVSLSRLVYRKGIDLLISSIPKVCALDPKVRFIIAGEGPKIVELEQMKERGGELVKERVELIGGIKGEKVRDTLTLGQIYLQTSLTEAFGIGILEAASCGLFVVATKVGGVPEVLPEMRFDDDDDDSTLLNDGVKEGEEKEKIKIKKQEAKEEVMGMIKLCEPDVNDIVSSILLSISHVRARRHDPWKAHRAVKEMYSWEDVAERTERVYERAWEADEIDVGERMKRYYACGPYFGKVLCMILVVQKICMFLLDWWSPRADIDPAGEIDSELLDDDDGDDERE